MNEYPKTAITKMMDKILPGTVDPESLLPIYNRREGIFRVFSKRLGLRVGSGNETSSVVGYLALCVRVLDNTVREQDKKIDKLTKIVEHLVEGKVAAKPKPKAKPRAKKKA